ncbi:Ig-like domain-containing protein [Pseudomonas sp. efr-133-TYG-5]|uniref:Ig-like domain-containing protein n=1 Tax=Pseudomonas sp. efr-133-TYG-5 TaxID=3040310 RepID=UPI00255664AE|nr:Ig-like domain-containing protein [Pseudomonas sp. efr-133-TYG-5]
MKSQDPQFSFFSTLRGVAITNPGVAPAEGIEFGVDGPAGDSLEVTDNGSVISPANSKFNSSGRYLQSRENLTLGGHTYGVRRNASLPLTDHWRLTVNASGPLSIDQRPMRLDGVMVRSYLCIYPNGIDAVGNTEVRTASGGQPPYTYSSNSGIAVVDANGKVTGMGNGSATITVTDALGVQVEYIVLITNVYGMWAYHTGYPFTYANYQTHQNKVGYIGLTPALRAVLQRCYRQPWFELSSVYPTAWTGAVAGEVFNYPSGSFSTADLNSSQSYGLGFYLYPAVINGASLLSDGKDDAMVIAPPPSQAGLGFDVTRPVLLPVIADQSGSGALAMTTQNPQIEIVTSHPGGTEIKSGDSTTSKAIEMVGSGTPYALYVITDNGDMVASGEYNGSGRFINRFDNLQIREHLYELRANASLPPTSVWKVIVLSADGLSIDSLKGLVSGVEIGEGSSTSELLFALTGHARANATVDLYDNGTRVAGPIAVGPTGEWSYNTGQQAQGAHSYTVRGNYDSGPESTPPRTLTIASFLTIDTSLLVLNGVMLRTGYSPNLNGVDAPGNTAVRRPTGGVEPYIFRSSAAQIASVDNMGKVTGMNNGTATITVSDQTGANVSYDVIVSNVYDLTIFHFVDMPYPRYAQFLLQNNWIGMTPQIREVLGRCFNHPYFTWTVQPNPRGNIAWTGPTSGNYGEAYSITTHSFSWTDQIVNHPLNGLGFFLKK